MKPNKRYGLHWKSFYWCFDLRITVAPSSPTQKQSINRWNENIWFSKAWKIVAHGFEDKVRTDFYDPEIKQHSMVWRYSSSPRPRCSIKYRWRGFLRNNMIISYANPYRVFSKQAGVYQVECCDIYPSSFSNVSVTAPGVTRSTYTPKI